MDGQRQSGFDLYHNKRDANTGGFYGVDSRRKPVLRVRLPY